MDPINNTIGNEWKSWNAAHCLYNGKNGQTILINSDGTMSANSKTPGDCSLQTFSSLPAPSGTDTRF